MRGLIALGFESKSVAFATVAALLGLAPAPSVADLLSATNEVRAKGCAGKPGVTLPLRAEAKLDEVARDLSQGTEPRAAMSAVGYRAVKWVLIQVASVKGDADVARVLGQRYCEHVTNPAFRDVGIFRRNEQMWILMAAPLVPPKPSEVPAVSQQVLKLVNQARSSARRCGDKTVPAAAPLRLSLPLGQAALWHAQDMAARNYFSHEGRDGSTPAIRATRAGYRWRAVGENIAAGPTTPEGVMKGWLGSPDHCATLMSADFSEMGVAYAFNPKSESGIYWAQEFAAPQ